MTEAMQLCIEDRFNVVISGGTSTGKATFARALLEIVDTRERLVTIEDAFELFPTHASTVLRVGWRVMCEHARFACIYADGDLHDVGFRPAPGRCFWLPLLGSYLLYRIFDRTKLELTYRYGENLLLRWVRSSRRRYRDARDRPSGLQRRNHRNLRFLQNHPLPPRHRGGAHWWHCSAGRHGCRGGQEPETLAT
ncbi:Flp pilus assembly complex ATPase component [Yangia sp. PrR002]|nr:Flp pilus assembly complex ATPase component [Salipiger sp. PrR002]NDW60021.1 Flp pilus assembly complex ATPase component [Salipiger sp. PrR004]